MMLLIKSIIIAVLLFVFELSAFGQVNIGNTTLKNTQNKATEVSPGEITVVQFWASWCVSCGETMQKLNQVSRKNKVKLIGVSLDEELSAIHNYVAAKPFMKRFKNKILWDPEATFAEKLRVQAIPSIIVFDKSGKEVYRKEGKPDASDIRKINKAIKGLKS